METLEAYKTSAHKYALLTPAEELEAAHQRCNGDKRGVDTLIKSNLRLVIKIAKKDFGYCNMDQLDLISAGNVGLMTAAEKFDPVKAKEAGSKFSTYAAWWIKRHMNHLRIGQPTQKTISMPVPTHYKHRRIKAAEAILWEEHDTAPTDEEIAVKASLLPITVNRLRKVNLTPYSLDGPICTSFSTFIGQFIANSTASPWENMQKEDRIQSVRKHLAFLPKREQDVLVARFGLDGHLPRTLDKVAAQLHLSRERIRQLQTRALKKLKKMLRKSR